MRLSFYPSAAVTAPELHLTPETPEERRWLREDFGPQAGLDPARDYCPDGTAVLRREVVGLPLTLGKE